MPRSQRREESGARIAVRVVLDTNVVISAALKPGGIHAALQGLIASIRLTAHHVNPERVPRVSRDVGDDMVLACAEAGAADYLVTGNLLDFRQRGAARA